MAFTDLDLMNLMRSEINRLIDTNDYHTKKAPNLDEIEGDYASLLESLMEEK